jgi:hypothetical protein
MVSLTRSKSREGRRTPVVEAGSDTLQRERGSEYAPGAKFSSASSPAAIGSGAKTENMQYLSIRYKCCDCIVPKN